MLIKPGAFLWIQNVTMLFHRTPPQRLRCRNLFALFLPLVTAVAGVSNSFQRVCRKAALSATVLVTMMKNLFSFQSFTRIFVGDEADSLAALALIDSQGRRVFEFPFELAPEPSQQGNLFAKSVVPCMFDGKLVGSLDLSAFPGSELSSDGMMDLAFRMSSWLLDQTARQVQTAQWLASLYHALKPTQRDWVGVYWKVPEGLVVGPYIGPRTPHSRIAEGQGLCGLAVREKKTVNVADVTGDPRFLACSTSTRSEIVIPICSATGAIVGELDIDSNTHASFDSRTQAFLEEECRRFGGLL